MSAKKIIKIRDDLDLEYMKDEFILMRETEVGKHTIISIKSTLNGFLKEYPDLLEQKLKLAVMKFLSGKSNEYFNKQLQALRSFFQYLVSEGHLIKDYTEGLKFKSHTVKIVQHSEETIKKFIDIPDRSTYAGLRDYTLIQTMIDSGLRPNEIIQLKITDIDFQNKYINVRAYNVLACQDTKFDFLR